MDPNPETRPTDAPVPVEERVVLVDALRGVALLGILLVNMSHFAEPSADVMYGAVAGGPLDRLARAFVHLLAEGKFYAMFSLLFGLGLYLQMIRAEARGVRFRGRWARRQLILLAFGVVHGCLIWSGDILTAYALLGLLLLRFRQRSSRALWAWALSLILGLTLALAGIAAITHHLANDPGKAADLETKIPEIAAEAATARRVYGSGTFREATALRASDYATGTATLIALMGPVVLAMFLLGIWVGRRRLLHEPADHRPLLWRLLAVGLGVGVPANLLALISTRRAEMSPGLVAADFGHLMAALAELALGGPALCLGYLAAAALLWQRPGPRRLLAALAPVGGMALSNYLLQSLVCTSVFYGYGLGQFGKVGPAGGLALTLAIYTAQVLASRWWLARFRRGPAEWLWRTLTYGSAQPLRRSRAPAAAG